MFVCLCVCVCVCVWTSVINTCSVCVYVKAYSKRERNMERIQLAFKSGLVICSYY